MSRVCLSVVALYHRKRQIYPFTKCNKLLSGTAGGGDVGEKKQNTEIQRTEDLTYQVEPFKAHAQPKMFSLGVSVLLVQGWLSTRRFQWTLYNHIVVHVALCKHHSNLWFDHLWLGSMTLRVFSNLRDTRILYLSHLTSSNATTMYGLHIHWKKPIKPT